MTEVRGVRKRNPVGAAIAAIVILVAAVVWIRTLLKAQPSTDDASIDVEVVHIAPLVGGRIIELPIHENELVHKGDLLFRIDPVPYQINVATAEAKLEVARAALVQSGGWSPLSDGMRKLHRSKLPGQKIT